MFYVSELVNEPQPSINENTVILFILRLLPRCLQIDVQIIFASGPIEGERIIRS